MSSPGKDIISHGRTWGGQSLQKEDFPEMFLHSENFLHSEKEGFKPQK
jgi:hypothetical protein